MRRALCALLVLNAALIGGLLWEAAGVRAGGTVVATRNGDANGDGFIDISDAMLLLEYLFLGGRAPAPMLCAQEEPDVFVRLAALEERLAAVESLTPSLDEKRVLGRLDYVEIAGKPTINLKADLQVHPEAELPYEIKALSAGDRAILDHFEVREIQPVAEPARPAVPVLRLTGNLQIVNGVGVEPGDLEDPTGSASLPRPIPAPNGLGNLIVGYLPFLPRPEGWDPLDPSVSFEPERTGSHNIVMGYANGYTGESGFVNGDYNHCAGWGNYVSGSRSAVSGRGNAVIAGAQHRIDGGRGNCVVAGGANRIDGDATGSVIVSGGGYLEDESPINPGNDIHGAHFSAIVGGNLGSLHVNNPAAWTLAGNQHGVVLLLGDDEQSTALTFEREYYGLFETDEPQE